MRFTGVSLLFTAFHIVAVHHHRRLNDWDEVVRSFEGVRRRGG
jgi:5'(3')-deoxyribonucleotidase